MKDLKELLKKMTIEEKIGQLTQLNGMYFINTDAEITGNSDNINIPAEEYQNVGSALTFLPGETFEVQKNHLENDRNKIPMIFMMDVIHGYRTIYPIPLALGCSFDPKLVEECSAVAAKEASAGGINATFTPMVDLARDPRWGRVMETSSEDQLINGIMGVAQVKGFQGDDLKNENRIATCVKHFAAYGAPEGGRDYNTVDISETSLRENYLPAYKACIDAGTTMVMTSFNTLNGIPSVANPLLMKKILKKEWNFEGVVISDYNALRELITHGVAADNKDAAKLSFTHGCDIEMCSDTYYSHLKELIDEGVVTEEELDSAVLRVLELKDKLGLFENPYRGYTEHPEKIFLSEENRAVAKRAAEESAVLLKNNNILPLSTNIRKIALIGPFADNGDLNGPWSCCGKSEDVVTVLSGIKNLLPDAEITVEQGCSCKYNDFNKDGFDKAIAAAENADAVILCLGEPQEYSGEGNCRVSIELPGVQNELAKVISEKNKNTVAIIFGGRPLALTDIENSVPAILDMWFPGTEAGNAVANLLFGKANPSGKITMTFPKTVGQCPIYYNRHNTGRPRKSENDEYLPYTSGYVDCGNAPLYPFGYGLSYSDFHYESLELSENEMKEGGEITATVTVHNKSNIPGKETVLLFMQDPVASVSRPIQKLIAFEKVHFDANEIKTVSFKITEEMLKFVNFENELVSEKGEFRISTGYADNLIYAKSFILK